MKKNNVFMTGKWENLIMANYVCDPKTLIPYLPKGTEIDFWNGKAYLSLVGFTFSDAGLFHIPIPFHGSFPEMNLRFYVRYKTNEGWRKGVVFIKEAAPKLAVALTARLIYNENFVRVPMRSEIITTNSSRRVEYYWKFKDEWNFMKVIAQKNAGEFKDYSEEKFIADHYWAYTQVSEKKTVQYLVEHRPWRPYKVHDFSLQCNVTAFYGPAFQDIIHPEPSSVFLVDGSPVQVRSGDNILAGIGVKSSEHKNALPKVAVLNNG